MFNIFKIKMPYLRDKTGKAGKYTNMTNYIERKRYYLQQIVRSI
jgi:hypothetical protein